MVEKTENQEETNVNNELFKGVKFCLCDDINDLENVKRILTDKGGKHVNYLSDHVTHLIADNSDHPNVIDAIDIYDKVAVTSQWVILSEKANVLLPLEPFYTDRKNKIFDKSIIAISGNLSKEDRSKLWAMLTYYGGEFRLNLTDQCTHLVTSKCNGKKYDKASSFANLKIVSPDWILDSIDQGKRCVEDDYHPKYLITSEYLQMKKEREERLRLEQERKRKEEEIRKMEEERKRLEDERRKNEEKKRIEEERKRFLEEEKKRIEEAKKNAATNIVQNKLSNVNISSSSSSASTTTINLPAISTQTTTNSVNVPTTQLTLRTVSLPSSTIVSNISSNSTSTTQQQTTTTINSPIKSGQTQKIKFLLPNQLNTTRVPTQNTNPQTTANLQNPQQYQIKQRVVTPQQHTTAQMTLQPQQQNAIYTTDPNLMNQQQQQPIQYQQVNHQMNAIQKPMMISNTNQSQQIQQNYQQHSVTTNQQIPQNQLRTGDQMNAPRQQAVYLAVQQPQMSYRSNMNQINLIQFRPQQFTAVPVQQQQIVSGQQNQQQIRPIQTTNQQIVNTQPQLVQQTIVSNANMTPKLQPTEQQTNVVQPGNTVQKSTNIILQQRVQPPVQMQAQQTNQQHQTGMQTTNIQPMIQLTAGNTTQLNAQANQTHSIQVLPGQQFFQIQRHPVSGQINQQQILRAQNHQQIIYQPANNNLQQNGPRQTIPQGAIFQQSPNQTTQIQRVQQLRMPQNIQQQPVQNQQVTQNLRLTAVSPIHAQQTNQPNLPQGQQSPVGQLKQQRFLIKSPPQYIQQQSTPTSMVTIRTPIQQQQNQTQMQQQKLVTTNQNQMTGQISPQINKSQIVNKFQTNQPVGTTQIIRNQWANDQQQIMRPITPNQQPQQMMQIGSNQVMMSSNTIVQHSQQIGQPTTMILQSQGQPQHQINQQTGQWSTNNNQQLTPTTMVHVGGMGVRPTMQHNVQIQQQSPQQQQQIRLIHQPQQRIINQQSNQISNDTTASTNSLTTSITDPNEMEIVIDKYYNYDSKLNVPTDLCLIGCVFYLVEYDQGVFKLDETKRKLIESNIVENGGLLATDYSNKITHVICESFSNQQVQRALKENKRCVTIFWLDDVLEDKKMRYPFKPWHLPRKFNLDASPCKNKIISISNFNTNERNRIYEMIFIAKGKYTSYMTQQNNLLICKKFETNGNNDSKKNKKFKKAVEWGINTVNHLWLQDMWFDNLKDVNDRRYKFDNDKDVISLDYVLTKDLMIGWKSPLKLNEQDQKRLNEFRESLCKNWKKPDSSLVLTSKENIINNSASSISTRQPLLIDKLNGNSSFKPILQSNINSNQSNTTTVTTSPSTLSTFVISNPTDTLTIVTVSTCNDKITKTSPSITTKNTLTTIDNSSFLQIKREENSSSQITTSITPTIFTDQKQNFNELTIKKEKIDDDLKVPNNDRKEIDVQKEDNQMEIDLIVSNNDQTINRTTACTTLTNSTDSIITQSTTTKPSLIQIKPNNLIDNKEIDDIDTKTDNAIVCTTTISPMILTVSSVNTQSIIDSTTLTTSKTDFLPQQQQIIKEEIGLVNGDCNPNNKQSIDIEMMEVDTSIKLNTECPSDNNEPQSKRLKLDDKIDVEFNSICSKEDQSRGNQLNDESNKTIESKEEEMSTIKDNNNASLMNGLQNHDSSLTMMIIDKKDNNIHHNLVSKERQDETDYERLKSVCVDKENNLIKSNLSSDSIKVFFTNVSNVKDLSEIVVSLGGKLVTDYKECTHLISSKAERTAKFVCAFNYANYILVPDWLIKSKESGCFLSEQDYFLNDQLNEEHFGFSIKESFERRSRRKHHLFDEMIFFITRSCVPSYKIIMEIVKSAGGMAITNKIPSIQQIEQMKRTNTKFVVISCQRDLYLCDLFYEKEIPVLHSEFVLSNILRQEIEYEPYLIGYTKN